jgi:hypothetical protein
MMTAQEYRARADMLVASADMSASYALMLHLDASVREWRKLAEIADWQDAMLAALAATADGQAS